VRNRLNVGFFEGDEFVCKQTQCPATAAIRWITTGECDKMSLLFTVELALVLAVGIAAMNPRDPVLMIAFSGSLGCDRTTIKDFSDLWIAEVFVRSK
jgi:hypothetical protein